MFRDRNDELDKFFDVYENMFNNFNSYFNTYQTRGVDLKEYEQEYVAQINLPRFKKEDVTVDVNNKVVYVEALTGESTQHVEEDAIFVNNVSKRSASFSFPIPESGDENKVTAKFKDSILTITIMKREVKKEADSQTRIKIE